MFVKDVARATVCTIAQLAKEWSKGIKFDLIIIAEATVMTEAQMVQIWCDPATLLCISSQLQLSPMGQSKPRTTQATDNPFIHQYTFSPYVRFLESNWPYAMLLEVSSNPDDSWSQACLQRIVLRRTAEAWTDHRNRPSEPRNIQQLA